MTDIYFLDGLPEGYCADLDYTKGNSFDSEYNRLYCAEPWRYKENMAYTTRPLMFMSFSGLWTPFVTVIVLQSQRQHSKKSHPLVIIRIGILEVAQLSRIIHPLPPRYAVFYVCVEKSSHSQVVVYSSADCAYFRN